MQNQHIVYMIESATFSMEYLLSRIVDQIMLLVFALSIFESIHRPLLYAVEKFPYKKNLSVYSDNGYMQTAFFRSSVYSHYRYIQSNLAK